MIRHLLLCAALCAPAACSKKEDTGKETGETAKTAEPPPPLDKGTPGEAADETEPPPLPDKPSSPPAVAAAPIDCAALLTAEDVATACGGKAADIEVRKHAMETGSGATTCMRQAGAAGKRTTSLHFAVNSAPGSAEGARALLDLSSKQPGAKPVTGVGDGAYLHVREVDAAKQTAHDLEAIKGALWFKLGYEVDRGGGKPPCSDDGLVELARTIAGRLP